MTVGIGPQIGFIFPIGSDRQGYLNQEDKDIEVKNRRHGWSAFATVALTP